MITNKKLLIDQDCPMCGFYGAAFTKLALIDQQTLYPYQTASAEVAAKVDMDRARNAIALHGPTSTVYGIDAFIEIISQKNKYLRSLLEFPMIYHPLLFLYNLISYNRKLIYPVATAPASTCIPDRHLAYRWAYILLVAIFTGLILNLLASRVLSGLGYQHHPYLEWLMCFGQILWQGTAVLAVRPTKTLDYLGNMSTVSLIGGLVIAVLLLLGNILPIGPWLYLVMFGLVVTFMLAEHIRRCSLLGLPITMTISWIVFRALFLLIMLYKMYVL